MIIQHNTQAVFTNGKVNTAGRQTSANAEKLASGYRINRAADDAAGLSISEKMRSQVRGLNRASDNIQDGLSLTNVADGALTEIHSILQRQRELLVQAANDTNTDLDRQAIEDEIASLSGEFDRIFDDTEFNTLKIFKGENEIIEGPDITAKTMPVSSTTNTTTNRKTEDVWLPKNPKPNPTPPPTVTTTSSTSTDTDYIENETPHGTDSLAHDSYDVELIYRTTTTTTTTEVTTTEVYTPISSADYTSLRKPGDMVGSNGYINVKNVKGNLDLSCGMSRLGIKVDGIQNLDLYNSSSIPKTTTVSADKNTAATRYDLGDGLFLTQTIALVGDSYSISYQLENTGTNTHNVDVRLAFDTMNTKATCINTRPAPPNYTLANSNASIDISATNTTHTVLGSIDDLYSQWDDSKVQDGTSVRNDHTGVGCWWEGSQMTPGSSIALGAVSYGPITLTADPYSLATTVDTKTTVDVTQQDAVTSYAYMPEYIDIQSGSLARQNIPIMLYNLSSATLNLRVPTDMSAFRAGSSIDQVDRVIDKISSIRSYYGALTNRMEHACAVDDISAENTQAAESRIRDLDMAKEMVDYSKNNILSQASQSMLAQANQSTGRVLELLQI